MVLNKYRDTADKIVKPIAEKMKVMEPNTLSVIAFVSAMLAGLSFYLSDTFWIVMGVVFVLLNSFFDAMDGRVAKLTGKSSTMGDFLDHTLDRYADIFILGGIAFGGLCRLPIGFFAVIGVLMTSYMGTQAHAVGVGRDYGGVAGRADRLILLVLVPLIYVFTAQFISPIVSLEAIQLNLIEILMIWFAIAGNLTAVHRGVVSWRELKKQG